MGIVLLCMALASGDAPTFSVRTGLSMPLENEWPGPMPEVGASWWLFEHLSLDVDLALVGLEAYSGLAGVTLRVGESSGDFSASLIVAPSVGALYLPGYDGDPTQVAFLAQSRFGVELGWRFLALRVGAGPMLWYAPSAGNDVTTPPFLDLVYIH